MITIVDYGRGNLFSLSQALRAVGCEHSITQDAGDIVKHETIILPGVGAFGDAMTQLRANGMDEALTRAAASGKRILGICLGMQLLTTRSEEFGDHNGLNLIGGEVLRLPGPDRKAMDFDRVPNTGWRRVKLRDRVLSLCHSSGDPYYYFVHSYGVRCTENADVAATITVNNEEISAIVGRGNIWGFQFHPEKSGLAGLALLKYFVRSGPLPI